VSRYAPLPLLQLEVEPRPRWAAGLVRRGLLLLDQQESGSRTFEAEADSTATREPALPPSARDRSLSVPCLNPRYLRTTCGTPARGLASRKSLVCRHFAGPWQTQQLLAMQKVEGSNPFSRSQKACICRPFLRASRLVRLRRVGLTPDSPRADRRPFQGKRWFAGRFWFVRTEVLLWACRRSGVRPAAAVSPTRAATARSCGQRPPARYQRSRSLGASPVSVRKPRGQPSPRSATRRATAPRAVSFLRRTASEAAAWCPSPWACGAAGTRVIAEGVAFHRRAGVCARTWAGLLIVVPCERPKSGGRHARVQRKPVADGRSARCPGCGGTRARGVRGRAPLSRAPGRGMALALAADSGVACRHGDLSRLWCRAAGAVAVVGRGWRQASGGTSLPSCSASSSGERPKRAPHPRVRALGGAALV
jgi:hypothetical protein